MPRKYDKAGDRKGSDEEKGEDQWCGERISSHHHTKQATSERNSLGFWGRRYGSLSVEERS